MFNFLKRLFGIRKRPRGGCPYCGGILKPAKADISETYGKPVKVCTKCKRLVEI